MIPGLAGMLARGYVVVATDYPGLGTPGPHPYLFGTSEGRAVLDAVRAARAFAPAQASARFALWGHSQGGHASLFAATLAPTYAPELALVGVAVAAPATGLATLLHVPPGTRVTDSLYAMVLDGWARTMDWPLDDVVRAEDVPSAQQLSSVCISPPFAGRAQPRPTYAPNLAFTVRRDITADDPWTDLVAENTPSAPPAGVPVLLAHGGADTTIPPPVTHAFLTQLCAAGTPVRDLLMPGVPHALVARDAAPQVVAWLGARFAGRAAPNDCGRERPTRSASRR
jgi:alpha-beta hydrolase superfamily lysophospholipase